MTLRVEESHNQGRDLEGIFVRAESKTGKSLAVSAQRGTFLATDDPDVILLRLTNGVLTYSDRPQRGDADCTVTTTRRALPALATGTLAQTGIEVSGDETAISRLLGVLSPGDPDFAIVTP